jgi:methylmalonyl-CoA carboxyltransferase large subunit
VAGGLERDGVDFMGLFLLPLGIIAGWVAGAAMSRRMVHSEVSRLEGLIAARNGKVDSVPVPAQPLVITPAPPRPAEPEVVEEVSPEIIMVLTAAVAAFLGKRARIRGARLVRNAPSSAWAQQGRVFVQASHNLGVMHGR